VFLPRVMRPLPTHAHLTNPNLQHLADAPLSVVHGPPGSYVAEWLAAAIQGWDRWQGCVWLRSRSPQPAALAGWLTSACLQRWADDLDSELPCEADPTSRLDEAMRLSPAGAVIVLEFQGRITAGLAQMLRRIRPVACDREVSMVAVTQHRFPGPVLRGSHRVVSTANLWDPGMADKVAELPSRCHDRLLRLAPRRAAILHDLLDATRAWPADAVVDALEGSRGSWLMLDRLTANLVDLCSPGQRAALEVCVATGYWHPQLATDGLAASQLRPWVVPLEHQWGWLRPIWARSLQRQLTARSGQRQQLRSGDGIAAAEAPRTPAASGASAHRRGRVEAALLGTFELRLDGQAVTKWPGQRGISVLRFLLSRPRHACSRDALLAEFWPEVEPAAARNRLQVAVSGLRRALQEVTTLQVIEYADGGYRIHPELVVDVDVERFEKLLASAPRVERSGDLDGALVAYQEAIGLYRGDFASDAPYEQWALLPRESLRMTYIDALDRVGRIQFGMGRLDDCITTGLRMLAVDPCREDAHRLLMRCYADQGRIYQALRQYDFCCRVLQATLETGPTPQTTQVYRAIREGSVPEPSLIH
jgi:DNA-binding SARP family transcriptional activator